MAVSPFSWVALVLVVNSRSHQLRLGVGSIELGSATNATSSTSQTSALGQPLQPGGVQIPSVPDPQKSAVRTAGLSVSAGSLSGRCGWVPLPERVALVPLASSPALRHGNAEDSEGSPRARWAQYLDSGQVVCSLSNQPLHLWFYGGGGPSDSLSASMETPAFYVRSVNPVIGTSELVDCDGVSLYRLVESRNESRSLEITSIPATLVEPPRPIAVARPNSAAPQQLMWYDAADGSLVASVRPISDATKDRSIYGGLDTLEIEYYTAGGVNASGALRKPSMLAPYGFRWILAAATQARSLYDLDRNPRTFIVQPNVAGGRLWWLHRVVAAALVVGLFFLLTYVKSVIRKMESDADFLSSGGTPEKQRLVATE